MGNANSWSAPVWSVVLVAAAMLYSFALACGMPFAAPGALAALALPRREAFATAILGWLANQAVGFKGSYMSAPTGLTRTCELGPKIDLNLLLAPSCRRESAAIVNGANRDRHTICVRWPRRHTQPHSL